MTLQATCYARFSSLEQRDGMSIQRQVKKTREICEANKWEWSEDRIIRDEARSAFSGSNRAAGSSLHAFEEKAKAGHFSNGHVLVVEHLDRVSREGYEALLGFINGLTAAGVTVATAKDIYQPHQRLTLSDVMRVLIEAEVAREESEKKSDRQLALWEKKLADVRTGSPQAITKLIPSWIVVDPKSRIMSLHPIRAEVIREIFEWCADGFGAPAIVKKLNSRAEPTWGEYAKDDEKRGRVAGQKRATQGWQVGQVLRLFTNPAVIGEYQPMKRARSDKLATVKGERIVNYYPPAIEHDLWTRAQAAIAGRRNSGGKTWARQVNLFSGIAFCSACGGKMEYVGTTTKGSTRKGTTGSRKPMVSIAKEDISYLQCGSARRQHQCQERGRFRYQRIEPLVLDRVLHLTLDDSHFEIADQVATIKNDIAKIERTIEEQTERLNRLIDTFSRTGSRAVEANMTALEAELDSNRALLPKLNDQLRIAQGQVSPEEHQRRIGEVRQLINDPDADVRYEARRKLHNALSKIVKLHCIHVGQASGIAKDCEDLTTRRIMIDVLDKKIVTLLDLEGNHIAAWDFRPALMSDDPKYNAVRELLTSLEINPLHSQVALNAVLARTDGEHWGATVPGD